MNLVALELKLLCDRLGLSVAVAESASAGHLQALIASVPGASSFFEGGVTVYNLEAKATLLGVDREHAASVDCVSNVVARQMAEGVADLFGADIGVSVTGYASSPPNGGPPHAYLGFFVGDEAWVVRTDLTAGVVRVDAQRGFAREALEVLARYLDRGKA